MVFALSRWAVPVGLGEKDLIFYLFLFRFSHPTVLGVTWGVSLECRVTVPFFAIIPMIFMSKEAQCVCWCQLQIDDLEAPHGAVIGWTLQKPLKRKDKSPQEAALAQGTPRRPFRLRPRETLSCFQLQSSVARLMTIIWRPFRQGLRKPQSAQPPPTQLLGSWSTAVEHERPTPMSYEPRHDFCH